MKIAVAAEGEHELGRLPDLTRRDSVSRVWIERLLGGFEGSDVELDRIQLHGDDLDFERRRPGEAEQSAAAYRLAVGRGCDGLVLFRDTDGEADTKRAYIEEGFAAAAKATHRRIPAVLALQVRMLEAWLLADAAAFQHAFRRRRPDLPKRPEEIWGKRSDSNSNHPKHLYARVLRDLGIEKGRLTAVRLAEAADLDVLARECPEGFGRFKADFERAFRTFDCVVAADRNHGIGMSNGLPWPRLKTDVKHFRDTTCGAAGGKRNALVMGRKTWDSIPEKLRPLAGRLNLVISRGAVALAGDAKLARSLDDALTQASLADDVDQIFVMGGAEIYRQAFEHVRCRDVWLTRIDGTFESDAHIPDVSERFVRLDDETRAVNEGGYDYRIERWRRRGRQ